MRQAIQIASVSIALLSGLWAHAQPVNTQEQTSSAHEQAKRRFLQGLALAKAGNCEGALAELKASYELIPRPNTLYNVARCQEELFQYADAVRSYEQYLQSADEDDPDRATVEGTIRSLKNLLGSLSVDSNVPADIWVGQRRVGRAPGVVLIPGGRHVIELRAEGYLPNKREVDIAGRQTAEVSFVLKKALETVTVTQVKTKGLTPAYFYTGAAITAGALVGGIVFGTRAALLDGDAQDIDARLPRNDERDQINTNKNIADVFYLSAGVFAVGTAVVYFLTDWGDETMSVRPDATQDSVGVTLGGRW